jgi:hypothetical protein
MAVSPAFVEACIAGGVAISPTFKQVREQNHRTMPRSASECDACVIHEYVFSWNRLRN